MDSLQFQHLIAALGELTEVQRQTVAAILCGHGELAEVTTVIEAVAKEKSATPAQVSLAWVMARKPAIVPIPGCKTRAHLEDNLRALEIELTQAELSRLDALMPPDPAKGAREQVTGARN